MNIFILDKEIKQNAQYHCDKHCIKMITESAQMLQNCFPINILKLAPKTQKGNYRKYSYWNHPCSKWTRQTKGNMLYLLELALELCNEYSYRYNKRHFTQDFIEWCFDNISYAELGYYGENLTPFAKAFKKDKYPDLYNYSDTIQAYREYYNRDKQFAKWTKRNTPIWYIKKGILK